MIGSPGSTKVAPFVHDLQVFPVCKNRDRVPQIDPGDFNRARPVCVELWRFSLFYGGLRSNVL